MNEKQIQDSIRSIEQMWGCDLMVEQIAWVEALGPLDSVTVAGTLLKLYDKSPQRPTVAQVIAAAEAMEVEKQSSPHVRTEDPWVPHPAVDQERGVFAHEISPWVKGWAVARYKHKDFRIFPQQKVGYDSHQIANPSYRTYVWPDQEPMPAEDVARYTEEGAPLKVAEIFSLIVS